MNADNLASGRSLYERNCTVCHGSAGQGDGPGGAAMGSAMPVYKSLLSEQERWQILLYIANGFGTETATQYKATRVVP